MVKDSADPAKNKFLAFSNKTAIGYTYSFDGVLESEGLREIYNNIDDHDNGFISNFIMTRFDLPIGSDGNAQLQYIEIHINKYFKDVVRKWLNFLLFLFY